MSAFCDLQEHLLNNTQHTICPRCLIGQFQARKAVYTRLVGDKVVSMPDMHAYVCDICGYKEYDYTAMQQLQHLINADGEKVKNKRAFSQTHTGDTPLPKNTRRPKL